jgi:integrase
MPQSRNLYELRRALDAPDGLAPRGGRDAKSRQTRHVPLNDEAMSVLRRWREQSGSRGHVFDVTTSFRTTWEKALKRAGIRKFRWHDLRHHFASRLVQRGVPLNTVRDLLGHSSVQMSLRYCAPGARPAARSSGQTQREAGSGAYDALTVERLSKCRLVRF